MTLNDIKKNILKKLKNNVLKKLKKNILEDLKAPNRIRYIRRQIKLPVSEISELLSCSDTHVFDIETGKSIANSDELIILCNLFGCTSDYLLGLSDSIGDYLSLSEKLIELRGDRTHEEYAKYLSEKSGAKFTARLLAGYEMLYVAPKLDILRLISKVEGLDEDYFTTYKKKPT